MDGKKSFGEYIRKKRQEAGLTQRQLAETLYVAESTVSKWERGLSYPDISLIPAVCGALGISEHEFFTACDDENVRSRERSARRWNILTRGLRLFFAAAYAIALAACFICDLAIFHRLDWFWIVLTSLMLAFSLTNLPFLVEKNRLPLSMAGATLSLFLLLLSVWLYTGGVWVLGGLAVTAVSLALPWGVWALWRFYGKHTAVWAMALFTAWVFALLAVIWAFAGGTWLLELAYPIAALAMVFLWAGFAVIRWLPGGGLTKAGAVVLLGAAATPAGQALARTLAHGRVPQAVDYLKWWRLFDMMRAGDLDWINLLTFMVLVLAGVGLLAAGVIRAVRRNRN